MTEREKALVEAVKAALRVPSLLRRLPEDARASHFGLYKALKAYADCPECCMSPELCAGTGRCPRDPVCNN
jgi:hypothetical protein